MKLHVQVRGPAGPHEAPRPVVVLEAGIAASSVSWSLVQERIARFTTVLSYDRAGFGFSRDLGEGDGTARASADDLAATLDQTGLEGPYVLAGHSFGGLIVRIFQQRFPERVAGLVLVDPVVRADWPEMTPRLRRGVTLSRRGAMLARIGVVRLALKLLTGGSRRIPQLLARVSAGNGAGVTDRLVGEVRKIPKEHWPSIAEHWSEARTFEAMARNLEKLPVSVKQLDESRSLGDLPVIVLSAGRRIPEHEADARLSTRGECVVVPESGHWMQLDHPEAVSDAIEKVVRSV
jgi:pimeloyl-ACP methyl ester carboxylesterase